jgi:uncharacterized membrane protein
MATSLPAIAVPKGTRLHRMIGITFATGIIFTSLSGFFIYEFTGGPSFFHVLAVLSLITITAGLRAIWRFGRTGNRRDLLLHYYNMSFSILGLWMAFAAQLAVNPAWEVSPLVITSMDQYWQTFAALMFAMYAMGALYIFLPGRRRAENYLPPAQPPSLTKS